MTEIRTPRWFAFLCLVHVATAFGAPQRWWPLQQAPTGIVTAVDWGRKAESPEGRSTQGSLGATHMLVQSLAGLAAQAVNENRGDEMVWIETDNPNYRLWYTSMVRRLGVEERGTFTPWELVDRYRQAGLIEGYVLYAYDYSAGGVLEPRKQIDRSVNVATTVAGLKRGVLIEEGLEAEACKHGLVRLFDARGSDLAQCFETYKGQLNRRIMLTQDPKVPHNRALAIAHRCVAAYGTETPVGDIMAWLEPLSPILGWNCGGEMEHTALPSRYGHFQTASNWALNLPLLSAGSDAYEPRKIKTLDPTTLDWSDERYPVSFIMTDGDNVQWMLGNFFAHEAYWANPHHGQFPFGWTACPSHLGQACPDALDHLAGTQPAKVSIVEYGGGYHYPDLFGVSRTDPTLQRRFAARVSEHMVRTGTRVFGFICQDVDSPAALKAYATFARHIQGLVGMIAVQYYPYDGGDGEIFWVQNRDGIDIPVVTAKFSLWKDAHWPGGGSPAKIASLISGEASAGRSAGCWVAVHAWSRFEREGSAGPAEVGLTPVSWCIERIDKSARVVSPEELLWRLRMRHNPEQTRLSLQSGPGDR